MAKHVLLDQYKGLSFNLKDGSKRNANGNERAQTEEHSTVDVISNLLKQ